VRAPFENIDLRIALYHPWIYVKSGLERTIMEIKRRSRHDWVIYTGHYDAQGTYPELMDMEVRELKKVSVRRNYGDVISAGLTIASTKIDDPGIDALLVSCDGLGSFITFANPSLPAACLCFTPLRAVYDPAYRKRVLSSGRFKSILQLLVEKIYHRIDRLAWRRYRHVFCISHEVEKRVLNAGLCDSSRIEIAYPGIDAEHRCISEQREKFFFLPGRIMWTKNLELAIESFLRFQSEMGADFSLIIAGMVDAKSKVYLDRLQKLAGGNTGIKFILNPTDSEMQDYYRRCYMVLFTAFNEDLGITPMEAGTFGKATIAVNRGGPCEVIVNDQTGLLVEPEVGAFCAAMSRMVSHPDEAVRMGIGSFHRSERFTWDRFVASIDVYFDKLALEGAQHR